MKRIITAILLLCAIWANAQQQVDSLRVKQSLRIKDARITNVTTDTSLSTNDLTIIAPAATIKQYFQNNIKSVSGSGQNMANANLKLNGNRIHNLNGKYLAFTDSSSIQNTYTYIDSFGINITTSGYQTTISPAQVFTNTFLGSKFQHNGGWFTGGQLLLSDFSGLIPSPSTPAFVRITKDSALFSNVSTGNNTVVKGDGIITPNIRLTNAVADNSADSIAAFKNGLFVKIARSNIAGLDTTVGDGRYTRIQRFLDSIAVVKSLANSKLTQTDADNRYARVNFSNTFAATNIFLDSLLLKNNTNNLIAAYKSTFGPGIGTGIIRAYNEVNSNYIGFSGEGSFQSFRNGVLTTLLVPDTSLPTSSTFATNVNGKFASSTGRIELGTNDVVGLSSSLSSKENTITAPNLAGRYWNGYKQFVPLNKDSIGLTNVDNTSDLNKPVSTATQNALNLKADKSTTITVGSGTSAQDISTNRTFLNNVPNIDATQRANHSGTQLASTISDFATTGRGLISASSPLLYNNSTGVFRIDTNAYVGKNRNNDTILGNKINRDTITLFRTTPILRLRNSLDSTYAEIYRETVNNKVAIRNQAKQNGGAGNSLSFNGSTHQGQFNTTGFPTGNTNSFTVCGWFFPTSATEMSIFNFGFNPAPGAASNMGISINSGTLIVNVGTAINNLTGSVYSVNSWNFFRVSYNGSTGIITSQCNNVVQSSTDQRANINLTIGNGTIGRWGVEGYRSFTGRIDQICFFNKVLSRNGVNGEVDRIYNNGLGTSLPSDFPTDGSLIRRWEFEDGTGTTAVENSGVSTGPHNMTFPFGINWGGIGSGKVSIEGSITMNDFLQNVDYIGTGEQANTILGTFSGRVTNRGLVFDYFSSNNTRPFMVRADGKMLLNPANIFAEPTINNTLDLVGNMSIGTQVAAPTNGLRVTGNSIFSNITTNSTTTIAAQINLGASTATANTGQIFFADGVNQTTVQNGLLNRVGGTLIWNVNGIAHLTPRALRTTATLDFPSIAAGATATLTVTLNNAVEADIADVSIPIVSQSAGLIWGKPRVTGTNTIALDVFNPTGSAIDPPSGTFVFTVTKYL